MTNHEPSHSPLSRPSEPAPSRRSLLRGAALGAVGTAAALQFPRTANAAAGTGLTPSQQEGPFYFDDGLLRPDIAEGLPGLPLRVQLRVLSLASQAPVQGAHVAIWHATAGGIYSGYAPNSFQSEQTRGRNYCRGVQLTDASGDVTFDTVFPGWYVVRTTHIHAKVVINGAEILTTQLYFDEPVNDEVFSLIQPYARRGNRPVRNNNDGGFDTRLVFSTTAHPGAYTASYTICIA